jgi:TetR/AcrR family transcriptional regulator, ethionamide resistance regulator
MSDEPLLTIQARSGKRRRETTVADVLDATRRLLQAGIPVSNLSVDQIVAEAGIARATFYLHFSDKHALIARLAEDEIAWRNEIGAEELASSDLSWEALEAMLNDIVSRWVADRAVLSAIIALAEQDAKVRLIWRASMREVAEKAAIQFRARWKVDDASRPSDTDTIAEIFTWMFERCCHQMAEDPTRAETLARSMSEIIWRVLNYKPA